MRNYSKKDLQKIWQAVPTDYYQKGVNNNYLQRMWHTGKLKAVLSFFPSYPKKILDVGSASGWFLNQISKVYSNSDCTGIDVYSDAIHYAKKTYPKLNFYNGDGHTLPFKNASFDVVMCNEVLEHVVDPMKVLSEIKKVMKDNAIGIIEMDSGNWMFRIVWYWWTHMRHGVWEDAHIQVYDAQKLEDHILRAGFKIRRKKFFNLGMAVVFQITK